MRIVFRKETCENQVPSIQYLELIIEQNENTICRKKLSKYRIPKDVQANLLINRNIYILHLFHSFQRICGRQ